MYPHNYDCAASNV
jgi:hypothetical protein